MTSTTTRRTSVLLLCAAALAAPAGAPAAHAAPSPAPLSAYFVDRLGSGLRVVREAVPVRRVAPADQRAESAANAVMGEAGARGHVNVWGERVVTDVTLRPDHVDVTLAGPTRTVDRASARVGVDSVVWTVTTQLGRNLPVVFHSPDGQVVGGLTTGARYTRAESSLAPLWIETPTTSTPARRSRVVATGTAVAHEATVRYRLLRGTRTVRSGYVTASVGAPDRGVWRLDLGRLRGGRYRLVMWLPDSSGAHTDLGRATRTFTVR